MKRNENNILLILFCAGIIGGMILPKWMFLNPDMEFGLLNIVSFKQYTVLRTDYNGVLKSAIESRMTLMLLLYFAAYTAAGFWIMLGVCLILGASLGFLAALMVIRMKYWGILFLICAIMPQWLLYGMAGQRIGVFMQKRRYRTVLCNGNAVPSYNFKTFMEFLQILLITCTGIAAEVYGNPWILRCFLNYYLGRS